MGTPADPRQIAHQVIGQMFAGGEGRLREIAAEIDRLAKETEDQGAQIDQALDRLTWRGAAADAFIAHERARVNEIYRTAQDMEALAQTVSRLADAY
ncbi:hypothetical protein [Phaeacidiphilus oryzae]|jgi:uncharacterized protein YukE|uniref:hypothetical protein n=1 Tax=Phaeacidiphilus oryzae TaxID=348818 RepID=UPI0006923AE0|nr:hypothetical protein [Phaeacidiphilus oryzae]